MNNKQIIIFRIDKTEKSGGGHFSRCIELAKFLDVFEIIILINGQHPSKNMINRNIRCYFFDTFEEEKNIVKSFKNNIKLVIFDVVTNSNLKNPSFLFKLIDFYKNKFNKLMFIDGIDEGSIIKKKPNLNIDFLVTPYFGATKINGSFKHFYGEKFFIISNKFKRELKKETKQTIQNCLVTFGQSDPYLITEFVLNGIITNNNLKQMNFKIILGSLFDSERINNLIDNNKYLQNKINFIQKPDNLNKYYLWADIAISGSGLTKYELAYFGIPSLIISMNSLDKLIQKKFDKYNTALHIGNIDNINSSILNNNLNYLVKNFKVRNDLSNNGVKLIDGKGCKRLASKIYKI